MKDNILEAITKINDLIEKRKIDLGEPTVHEYDDGVEVNFFKTWEEYFEGSLKKTIKKLGDYPKDILPIIVFAKRGINIPLYSFPAKKIYVVLRGNIDYFFEDGSILELTDYCSIVVPKNKLHGGMVRKDTFVLVIEEELDI